MTDALAARADTPLDNAQTDRLLARVRAAIPRLSDQVEGELREGTSYFRVKLIRADQEGYSTTRFPT